MSDFSLQIFVILLNHISTNCGFKHCQWWCNLQLGRVFPYKSILCHWLFGYLVEICLDILFFLMPLPGFLCSATPFSLPFCSSSLVQTHMMVVYQII